MPKDKEEGRPVGRIEFFDLCRTVCIVMMLVYHTAFDLWVFGALDKRQIFSAPMNVLQALTGCGFILISGAVSRYSSDPVRRGFAVFCAGFAVSLVTNLINMGVAFGILQMLGVSMMLSKPIKKFLEDKNTAFFIAVCLALFAAGCFVLRLRVGVHFLYPLGLRYEGFFSSDYYPMIPWFFLFAAGMGAGKLAEEHSSAALMKKSFSPLLTWPGRHSLVIYLLHQPIIFTVLYLIFGRE